MSTSDATEYVPSQLDSKPQYEIILFDYDDTLVDGQACHRAAWAEGAHKTNREFPDDSPITITPEFISYQKGRPNDKAVRFLGIDPESEKGRSFIDLKKKAAVANATRARWFPDALATLPRLPERGYEVGIVTSSHRQYVEAGLAACAPLHFLRTRITAREDYERGKSDPDCLIAACGCAGIPLAGAIYVGDALVDYETTRAAGCAFLLYSPKGAPSEEGLQGVPYIQSHTDIWRHI